MKCVNLKVLLIFVIYNIIFTFSQNSRTVLADDVHETFDLSDLLNSKPTQPLKFPPSFVTSEKPLKNVQSVPKKSLLKRRKPQKESPSKNKINTQSVSDKPKVSTPKSVVKNPEKYTLQELSPESGPAKASPKCDTNPEKYTSQELSPESGPAKASLKSDTNPIIAHDEIPEKKTKEAHESAPERRSISGDSIEESIVPANFQLTADEEEFVKRNERRDGKKLLFTLQIPSKDSGSPETFVCSPVGKTGLRSEPSSQNSYPAAEPRIPEQKLRNLDPHSDRSGEDPVVNDIVSKLKSAVLTFEDQIKNSYERLSDVGSEKEAERKLTRKFMRFVQKYLGLPEPEICSPGSETSPKEVINPPYVPPTDKEVPASNYVQNPSSVQSSQPGVSESAYSEKSRHYESQNSTPTKNIPAVMPVADLEKSRQSESITRPKSAEDAMPVAYTVNSRHHESSAGSWETEYPLSEIEDKKYSLSNIPRVIQSTDLSKYFPTTTQSRRIIESPKSEQPSFDGGQWRVVSPQREPVHPNSPPKSTNQNWSVNAARKPNEFLITQNIPIQFSTEPQRETRPSNRFKIPEFEHALSAEVPETATFPSVRAASKAVEPVVVSDRHHPRHHQKSRLKSQKNRKEQTKAPNCELEFEPQQPVLNKAQQFEPQQQPQPVLSKAQQFEPVPQVPHQFSIQYNFPGLPSTKVSIPTSDNHPSAFTVGAPPPGGAASMLPVPVTVQRVNASKFVVRHEDPIVINYQSDPYIVDYVGNPPRG
ncbi:unnamed protein product [Bemisia tabaci]|uniref:Uncharacterized protein n=1 Tax=Bemisia tabaci TaxID=7038 RepID=A0A9P0AJV8_BEMTA|nr:unnamed protein product [Bemisia tabaci]